MNKLHVRHAMDKASVDYILAKGAKHVKNARTIKIMPRELFL